jgi:sec-independent protein translocase protein TatA
MSCKSYLYPRFSTGIFYAMNRGIQIYPLFLQTLYLLSLITNFIIMIHADLLGVLGTNEIIIILIIVLLLFGGRKIPELMRGLGKGVREFNDAKTNVKKEIEESANDIKTT